jgi:hypothetical protein
MSFVHGIWYRGFEDGRVGKMVGERKWAYCPWKRKKGVKDGGFMNMEFYVPDPSSAL